MNGHPRSVRPTTHCSETYSWFTGYYFLSEQSVLEATTQLSFSFKSVLADVKIVSVLLLNRVGQMALPNNDTWHHFLKESFEENHQMLWHVTLIDQWAKIEHEGRCWTHWPIRVEHLTGALRSSVYANIRPTHSGISANSFLVRQKFAFDQERLYPSPVMISFWLIFLKLTVGTGTHWYLRLPPMQIIFSLNNLWSTDRLDTNAELESMCASLSFLASWAILADKVGWKGGLCCHGSPHLRLVIFKRHCAFF